WSQSRRPRATWLHNSRQHRSCRCSAKSPARRQQESLSLYWHLLPPSTRLSSAESAERDPATCNAPASRESVCAPRRSIEADLSGHIISPSRIPVTEGRVVAWSVRETLQTHCKDARAVTGQVAHDTACTTPARAVPASHGRRRCGARQGQRNCHPDGDTDLHAPAHLPPGQSEPRTIVRGHPVRRTAFLWRAHPLLVEARTRLKRARQPCRPESDAVPAAWR